MTCARRKSVSNNRAPSRTRNNRLPRCTGPKLHEFQLRRQHIEFVRQIDNEDAGHSHVFEIAISGRKYALKVVGLLFDFPRLPFLQTDNVT